MNKLLELPLRILLMVSGILFVFALPSLVNVGESISFNGKPFWTFIVNNFKKLTQISDPYSFSLFEQMKMGESYKYSMTIIMISLLVAIFVGTTGAILIQMTPKRLRSMFKQVINFFESVPDLLIIFLFMFFVITLYKSTGLKFLQLYGIFGHKPYFVPIVTVSFLPTLFFMQFIIKMLEGEETKDYVLYLNAKGLSRLRILIIHILRNILPLLIIQLRTSIWLILSNLYLLEFMLNIQGFTKTFQFAVQTGEFLLLVICLLLFTLPLVLVETVSFLVLKFYKGKESVSL